MKKVVLCAILALNFAAAEMLLGECRYIVHKLQNEKRAYLIADYSLAGLNEDADRVSSLVDLYPEEIAEFDGYLNNVPRYIDKCKSDLPCVHSQLKKKLDKVVAEIETQQKVCDKIAKKGK